MTQFIPVRKTFVAHFFVIPSIMIVLTSGTKIKSNHYSVWRYEKITIRNIGGNKSDETTNMTFDVKIRASTRHTNNALENQYNLVVKFENVSQLWFSNNNKAEDNYESHSGNIHDDSLYRIKLGADGRCAALFTKVGDNERDMKRVVALLLLPDIYYKMSEMQKYFKNSLSACFEETPLGSCKIFVQTSVLSNSAEDGYKRISVSKHTNADYCDEEKAAFESLTMYARPSISPDSSLDVKYLIDQTDNKLSRVEMLFQINYPSESESVQNSYILTYKGYEFIENEDDVKALTVNDL